MISNYPEVLSFSRLFLQVISSSVTNGWFSLFEIIKTFNRIKLYIWYFKHFVNTSFFVFDPSKVEALHYSVTNMDL